MKQKRCKIDARKRYAKNMKKNHKLSKNGSQNRGKINKKRGSEIIEKMIEKRLASGTLPECLSNLLEGNLPEKKTKRIAKPSEERLPAGKNAVRGGARSSFRIPTRLRRRGAPGPERILEILGSFWRGLIFYGF